MSAAVSASLTLDFAPQTKVDPVYVYGASGRCWKFNDPSKVEKYFNSMKPYDPIVIDLREWLIRKYGAEIIKRFSALLTDIDLLSCGFEISNKMTIEEIDHKIEITDVNGYKQKSEPARLKFKSPSANMTLIVPYFYSYRSDVSKTIITNICAKFFQDPAYAEKYRDRHRIEDVTFHSCIRTNDTFFDYWDGDRIVHKTPRKPAVVVPPPSVPAIVAPPSIPTPPVPVPIPPVFVPTTTVETVPEQTSCYPFLRFRKNRITTTPVPTTVSVPANAIAVSSKPVVSELSPLMIEID